MTIERKPKQFNTTQTIDQTESSCITMSVPKDSFSVHGGELRLIYRPNPSSDSIETVDAHDKEIEKFLNSVYILSDVGETRQAIDTIFDYFNKLIRKRQFNVCMAILSDIKVEKINSTLMVAFLSITLPVKDELWTRPVFFAKVKRLLVEQRDEVRASRLLDKYE